MSFFDLPFDHAPKYILFFGLNFVFLLIDVQILPLFLNVNMLMTVMLSSIYYWSIYNPRLLPSWFLFTIGLLKDFLSGFPIVGLTPLFFLTTHEIVKRQRTFLSGQSFFMLWAGYVFICTFITALFYGVLWLHVPNPESAFKDFLIEYAMMVFSFPVLLLLMSVLDRVLPFASGDKPSL